MPQEVKDCIVSGIAYIAREDKLDKSVDDNTTEKVTFTRDNPHMFALMVNTLWPAHDHKDEMDITQNLMEYAHIASDTQWEPKLMDNINHALSTMASDGWKQFRLMEYGWYVEDPT